MATFAFVLNDYVTRQGLQAIRLRVTIDRKIQYIPTGFSVRAKEWDAGKERVKSSNVNFTAINDALHGLLKKTEGIYAAQVSAGGTATAKGVKERTGASQDFHKMVEEYANARAGRTKDSMLSFGRVLKAYAPALRIQDIDAGFIAAFKEHLKKGRTKNGVVTVLSRLRRVYNDSKFKASPSPFESVKVGTYSRAKFDPLSEADIELLWTAEPHGSTEALARDTFLFSYYAAGMRPGDVLTLKWTNVKGDRLEWQEAKKAHLDNARLMSLPVHERLQAILDRRDRSGDYIFGLKLRTGVPLEKVVDSKLTDLNGAIKIIAARAGVKGWIAMKVARRTFADIANKKSGRQVYSIQQALGHSSIDTTEIYLGNDATSVDELLGKVYS